MSQFLVPDIPRLLSWSSPGARRSHGRLGGGWYSGGGGGGGDGDDDERVVFWL